MSDGATPVRTSNRRCGFFEWNRQGGSLERRYRAMQGLRWVEEKRAPLPDAVMRPGSCDV